MDYQAIAAALLAEVGLSFDDVMDVGRPWLVGPPGFQFRTGRPKFKGSCLAPNRDNPMSRQRHIIQATGPFDCEVMLHILAHECGHAALRHHAKVSQPDYEQEYEAELYANEAFRRVVGRDPHDCIIASGKKYVRMHCWARQRSLGPDGHYTKGWRRDILDWSGFEPKYGRESIH